MQDRLYRWTGAEMVKRTNPVRYVSFDQNTWDGVVHRAVAEERRTSEVVRLAVRAYLKLPPEKPEITDPTWERRQKIYLMLRDKHPDALEALVKFAGRALVDREFGDLLSSASSWLFVTFPEDHERASPPRPARRPKPRRRQNDGRETG